MYTKMDPMDMAEKMIELLGAEHFFDSLLRAVDNDELRECCEYIARMEDVDLEEEEEEEEEDEEDEE